MIKLLTAFFLVLGFMTDNASAGVRSIVTDSSSSDVAVSGNSSGLSGDYSYDEPSYDIDPAVQCQNSGFARRGCPSGYRPIGECPYDDTYYAGCCLAKYQYSAEDCIASRMKPSSDNCMGYYACEPIEGGTY